MNYMRFSWPVKSPSYFAFHLALFAFVMEAPSVYSRSNPEKTTSIGQFSFSNDWNEAVNDAGRDLGPIFLDAGKFPIDGEELEGDDTIPSEIKRKTVDWIKMIVNSKELPKDPFVDIEAFGNVKRYEYLDKDGRVVDSVVGDYFLLDSYDAKGLIARISENGSSVSGCFRLTDKLSLDSEKSVESAIKECVLAKLNYPKEHLDETRVIQHRYKSVVYGRLTTWKVDPNLAVAMGDSRHPFKFWWWENVRFMIDDNFLYLAAYEGDHSAVEVKARSGLPVRFVPKRAAFTEK